MSKNDDDNERVKTFLKIRKIDPIDKEFYKISPNKQIFTLFGKNYKKEDSINFEIDKIFTEENEYSYIYEEIARDCISGCLNGEHFTFISYGDSLSDKMSMLFGDKDCYKNINSRGIFPRILDEFMNTISSNKKYKNDFILNLSYFCINKSKLIDFSKLVHENFCAISQSDFINYGIDIKTSEDTIHKVKKLEVVNPNDVIFYITKIFDLLYKLEVDSLHLLSWSNFVFIIYLNDNQGKTISILSFIILAGNEQLETRVTNPKNKGKDTINNTKM